MSLSIYLMFSKTEKSKSNKALSKDKIMMTGHSNLNGI